MCLKIKHTQWSNQFLRPLDETTDYSAFFIALHWSDTTFYEKPFLNNKHQPQHFAIFGSNV